MRSELEMDDSWRFRSIHGDTCPTCSTPHSPFCPPPPPSFDRRGYAGDGLHRYPPPEINPPFHRPFHDPPFPDHRAPLPLPVPFPMPPPSAAAARGPEPWAHDLQRDPLRSFSYPSQQPYLQEELLEREGFRKRMRVEDQPAFGNYLPPPQLQPFTRFESPSSWISSEEERRLSLIRNHGRQGTAPGYEEGLSDQHGCIGIDRDFQVPAVWPASRNGPPLPMEPVPSHPNHPAQANLYDGHRDYPVGPQSIDRVAPQERRDAGRIEYDAVDRFTPQERRDVGRVEYDAVDRFGPQERRGFERRQLYANSVFTPEENKDFQRREFNGNDRLRPLEWRDAQRGELDTSDRFTHQEGMDFRRADTISSFAYQERKDFRYDEFDTMRGGVVDPHIKDHPYGRYGQHDSFQHFPMHGDSSERLENNAGYPTQEQPFSGPWPQVSYLTTDYAPRGPSEKYANDHLQVHLNESSSFIMERPPQVPKLNGSHPLLNTLNREQLRDPLAHATEYLKEGKYETHGQHAGTMRTSSEFSPPIHEDIHKPFDSHAYPAAEPSSEPSIGEIQSHVSMGQPFNLPRYPPLPPQPLPAGHLEPIPSNIQDPRSLPGGPPVLSPSPVSTSTTVSLPPIAHIFSESHPSPKADFYKQTNAHASVDFNSEIHGLTFSHQTPSKQYPEEGGQIFPLKYPVEDKPIVIDACHLFKQPHRALRPDHFVVILRGLPGSGKSYLAKALRDIEVENGGNAPRIHSMDDYFMIEVEKKVEDNDGTKSSTSYRGKKQITKKVIEYCYEPEMEEAYRSSMLKAFKKTLDEGTFTFIIVDDRNLRVADFAQFWAIAKRSGYEVYLLEAKYKDPAGCAARNVHGFTVDDIQKIAEQWEDASSLYLQLDVQSLFHGDDLNEQSIKEVDMDTDDAACDEGDVHKLQEGEGHKMTEPESVDYEFDSGLVKTGDRWDTEDDEGLIGVKELGKSKWSKDFDEDNENSESAKRNLNALSGLIQAYSKKEKSVHWGDRVDKSGFSIGAVKRKNISSLIIGPGSGYNLKSNPLLLEKDASETTGSSSINESKTRFHEQLRAERESFKAVFDRRRQRIGGLLDADDE